MKPSFSENKKEIIAKALTCKGWTKAKKLSLIYDLAKKTAAVRGDILEIGSAFGRSTVLLSLSSGKRLWSIDPHTGGRVFIERNENQDSFAEFKENLKKFDIKNIKILKHTTEEVIKKRLIPWWVGFSLIFIDGLHTPEGVTIDFNLAWKKLRRGGIVVFDDYFGKEFADYARTIDRCVEEKGIDIKVDEKNGLVYFEKK